MTDSERQHDERRDINDANRMLTNELSENFDRASEINDEISAKVDDEVNDEMSDETTR